jgi:RIO kinase 1
VRQHDSEDLFGERPARRRGRYESEDHEHPVRRRVRTGDETDERFSRRARFDDEPEPTRRGRLTEGERVRLAKLRDDAYTEDQLPDGADRWSTWDDAEHGPVPRPDWVVTELAAVDTELGVLKTGKEADVHLLRRGLPGTPGTLLAAKRYRSDEHKLFHRDAGYLEGRRMRRSREMRAMAQRTAFGRNLIAEQWAVAEFAALSRLWTLGAPVPYPVQRNGTELLLEFLGEDDGTAAPRLAQARPEPDELADLWSQATAALELLASEGLAHGDLSAYNLLVHRGRLVVIDLPQAVDVVANPGGVEFLARDVRNLAGWFHGRGLGEHVTNTGELLADLISAAGLG